MARSVTDKSAGSASDRPAGPPLAPGPRDHHLRRLARYFSPRPRRPLPAVPGNDVRLLVNGNEVFAAMLAAILTAEHSVEVEMYIWRADSIGRRFAELLKAKAAEGVRVRVIYDSVGSWSAPQGFWRELGAGGVQVAEFNPVAPWRRRKPAAWFFRRHTINNRDHRKIVLVDGRVGFVGGINIADEYVGEGNDMHHWRDTCVRVSGPVVARLAAVFDRQWRRVTGEKRSGPPVPRPAPAGRLHAIVLDSRPWRSNLIRRCILTAVRRARREIEITMAYFMPPPRLARALRRAARRGVRVTLILPARSDVRAVFYAGRSQYAGLLRAGVQIHECLDTVLHAKSIQVDRVWATVGSANLDLRSFRINEEVNLLVLGREFPEQLHQVFLADLARSRRVERSAWRRRPWLDKLRERFYRMFRVWL